MKGIENRSEFMLQETKEGFVYSNILINVNGINRPMEMVMNIDGMLNFLLTEIKEEIKHGGIL